MKKHRGLKGRIYTYNPSLKNVRIVIEKKDNPSHKKSVSVNSEYIDISNGHVRIRTDKLKKKKWVIIDSSNIFLPEHAPKSTTSTGPRHKNMFKKV
ncbi:TPA: hypothetical protein ACJIKU_000592 [Citrobacter freundii]|uniref:hypothetical protein n=1 Tax=Citrobacter freundii TaxID=546 RepID=UPI0028BEB8E1|nr:hypothetical protein [Citrobacter freundii]MDT7375834.1 hypothetical protein [Citrobacter freundii]